MKRIFLLQEDEELEDEELEENGDWYEPEDGNEFPEDENEEGEEI